MKNSLVIIPTFNEAENIEALLHDVFDRYSEVHVLVVDDNSPDGTAQLVEGLKAKYSTQLFLLSRQVKNGLGKAYIEGFQWGLNRGYDFFVEMDADFSHNPNDLQRLYEACQQNGADVAVGSRYVKGINVVNWPLSRMILSYGASWYVRLLTGMPVKDPTAGFVCYKRAVLETLDLNAIQFVGYAFQIEMKYKAFHKKFIIKEIPIIFTERIRGVSKLTGRIISEAVLGVIQMRIQKILGQL